MTDGLLERVGLQGYGFPDAVCVACAEPVPGGVLAAKLLTCAECRPVLGDAVKGAVSEMAYGELVFGGVVGLDCCGETLCADFGLSPSRLYTENARYLCSHLAARRDEYQNRPCVECGQPFTDGAVWLLVCAACHDDDGIGTTELVRPALMSDFGGDAYEGKAHIVCADGLRRAWGLVDTVTHLDYGQRNLTEWDGNVCRHLA